jgi:hypothetical protein
VPVTLTVYSRGGCHLCDDMLVGLQALQARHPFHIDVINIDSDPRLALSFGEHVPVLAHGGIEICRHRLDGSAVTAHLAEVR